MQAVGEQVFTRISRHGRGWVFSPDDFRDLGDPRTIGMALTRLVSKGTIRRLARGLYDFPKTDPVSGPVSPTLDAIAKALAGKHNLRLLPSGAYAASLLGLSEDKPAPIVFLTDGSSRNVRFGNQEIMLKQTTPRMMGPAGRLSGLVIQALRHLGQEKVNAGIIQKLKEKLTPKDRQQLLKDAAYAPAWVAVHLRAIATDETSP